MESFFSRYRNALVLITVLVAQVIGLAVQVRVPNAGQTDRGSVRLVRAWVVGGVSPPERVLHTTGLGIRGIWTNYLDLIHVRRQNQDLQAELDRLRLEEASLAEDARQGERLQAMLGFQEKYVYKTVAAQVIGASGTEQSQVLLIDKGSQDGIHPDMPVITPDGIVGKTRDVFAHTAQVLEISDSTSGAGVILEKTRIRGVLRGNTWGQPEIVNVSPDDRIQPGEPVLTSGGDAIFPRGLSVGVVRRVVSDPDGTLVNVLVKPAANLSKLEEVLVITNTGNQMPSEMQQDLSEAQERASDILADRLPSRSDPDAPPGALQDSQQSGPASPVPAQPPKPPAAVHADRYTPSDTPPAADLVPGQRIANSENNTVAADKPMSAGDEKKTVRATPAEAHVEKRVPSSMPSEVEAAEKIDRNSGHAPQKMGSATDTGPAAAPAENDKPESGSEAPNAAAAPPQGGA